MFCVDILLVESFSRALVFVTNRLGTYYGNKDIRKKQCILTKSNLLNIDLESVGGIRLEKKHLFSLAIN